MKALLPSLSTSSLLLALLMTSCEDSEKTHAERARIARFTTEVKPPPNPDKEDLDELIKEEFVAPTSHQDIPVFNPYSMYTGQNMHQLTGVSGRSLLLCFATDWCPHSSSMKESLQELAADGQGSIQVVVIDPDKYTKLAEEFGIEKVPITFLYVEGVRLRMIEGTYSSNSLQHYLTRILSKG